MARGRYGILAGLDLACLAFVLMDVSYWSLIVRAAQDGTLLQPGMRDRPAFVAKAEPFIHGRA